MSNASNCFAFYRHLLDVAPDELGERRAIALEPRDVERKRLLGLERGVELAGDVTAKFLDPLDVLFRARRMLRSLVELPNLDFHVPDQLVQAVRLDHRVLDGGLLALERLHLLADVLGQGVERRHPLLGRPAHLLKGRERAEFLFDFLDRGGDERGLLANVARGLAEPGEILGELTGRPAELLDVGRDGARALGRLPHVDDRLPELLAQLFQQFLILLERVEAVTRLQRQRRQALDVLAMFLQLAVRGHELLGVALRADDGTAERRHFLVERLDGRDLPVDLREVGRDLVEPRADFRRLLVYLLERFRRLGQPRALELYLAEHRAERAALFARRVDERQELVALLPHLALSSPTELLDGIQHGNPFPASGDTRIRRFALRVSAGACKILSRGDVKNSTGGHGCPSVCAPRQT